MGEEALIVGGGILIFATGFVIGAKWYHRSVRRKIIATQPLMANAMGDILVRASQEHLTAEQIKAMVKEEMQFIQIVS